MKEKIALIFLFMTCLCFSQAQDVPQYDIDVVLDTSNDMLHIVEKIQFKNPSATPLTQIQLNDWANAYSSTKSPLALRLVEEYNRSFYLSNKNKRGKTTMESIKAEGESLKWSRPQNKVDLINVTLEQPLAINEVIELELRYAVHLPDAKFTGSGKIDDNNYLLEHFFISLGRFDKGEWKSISHLDLEDVPQRFGNYKVDFEIPKELVIQSNLTAFKSQTLQDKRYVSYSASQQKRTLFFIGTEDIYESFNVGGVILKSNIVSEDLSYNAKLYSLQKISNYLNENIGKYPHGKLIVAQEKYDKRPFYGLTLIPELLKPFPVQFEYELRVLNTLLYDYLTETLDLHPREDFWFLGGLHSYLIIQYVNANYPDKKLFGLLMRQPIALFFLKQYHFVDLDFKDAYREFHEFILRNNLQQPVITNKEDLIKFNEQIGHPSQVGILINYLEKNSAQPLKPFIDQLQEAPLSAAALQEGFKSYFNTEQIEGFSKVFEKRNFIDLKFSDFKREKDSVALTIEEKNNIGLPFTLGWVKNDRLIQEKAFSSNALGEKIKLASLDADYLVINPTEKLAEFNPRNNWKKISGLGNKPFRFRFVKDIEEPQYNQIFYNPRSYFNKYDGLSVGVRLNNKSVKRKPLTVTAEPFYSTYLKTFVGSFGALYNQYNVSSPYYSKSASFFASSYHYDENLRYSLLLGSATLLKRGSQLRNNKKEALRIFGQYVNREQNSNQNENPNYTVGGISYLFSNQGALKHLTYNLKFVASDTFGKLHSTFDFRHLYPSGRQLSFRAFAGAFLWRSNTTSSYFDFALDRPTDYLFEYNYLGRSETTGIYSQQFIPTEGGFKDKFEEAFANQYMLTLNTSIGLLKWIEAYGDVGLLKNKNRASQFKFGSGLRLNIVPDFFELYFPVYNSLGWQIQPNYEEKIRFVIVLEPSTLSQLISRKWF